MRNLNLVEGFPQILCDYWMILDDNTKDAFKLMMKPFGNALILSGCGLSDVSGTLNIAPGVVFFNDTIMRVEAHTIATYSGATIIAETYTSTLVTNPKSYASGAVDVPLKTETYCRFIKRTTESTYTELGSFKQYGAGIGALVGANNIVKTADYLSGYTLASGVNFDLDGGVTVATGDRLKFKKTLDGRLLVSGGVGYNTYSNSATVNGVPFCSLICTVDVDFRPANAMYFVNYSGGVSGTYANTPIMGEAFVLFPDGKFCVLSKTLLAGTTFKIQNIQVIL
jgi:hypothetical protein